MCDLRYVHIMAGISCDRCLEEDAVAHRILWTPVLLPQTMPCAMMGTALVIHW